VRALLIVHLEWHRKHEELALAPELAGTTRPEAEAAPDEGQVALPPATMQVA